MTASLRILVAQNVMNDRRGGMSRMLGIIHDRVIQDGHRVDYLCSEQVPERWKGKSARFYFPWLVRHTAVAAAKAGDPYDIINVHEPSAAAIAALRRAAGNPCVAVTTHGVEERGWMITQKDAELTRTKISLTSRVWCPLTLLPQTRIAFRYADHVFCLNEEDREYIQGKYGIQNDRISRLFPGADDAFAACYEKRDYEHADTILFFGTWLVRKGTPDLIKAFCMLVQSHPRLRLVIMGAGFPAEYVLNDFPSEVRSQVDVVPAGNPADIAEQLLEAAVYVFPSLFEGTPATLMESMATGLPAVTTATCGMKDVVRDGVNGLLVPVRDPDALYKALERILADRQLRERLGRQAHEDVLANYTWDQVAKPVQDVYSNWASRKSAQS